MKLLFLTEKPSMKKTIEENFKKNKNSVNYDIDVATVNSFITSVEDAERFHFDIKDFKDLHLKSRKTPENYKIITSSDHHKAAEERIASLIRKNEYDFIINACDPDEAGDLMFDYTRETCGLSNYKTAKFDLKDWCSDSVLRAFKRLNDEI